MTSADALQRPNLHVLQVSRDDSVFGPDSQDAIARQARFLSLMRIDRKHAQNTLLVLSTRRMRRQDHASSCDSGLTFRLLQQRGGVLGKGATWLSIIRCICSINRQHPVDVLTSQTVHDEAWAVLVAGRLLGIPVVGQVHYDIFDSSAQQEMSRNSWTARLRFWFTLKLLPRFAAIRVVGTRVQRNLLERGVRSVVRVIPVAMPHVDDAILSPLAPLDEPVVLFVGRLVEQKNLRQWLEVAALVRSRLPDVRFRVAGDGPLRDALKAFAEALGLGKSVEWMGHVRYGELGAIYQDSAVFLINSRYEGFGRVAVEALANGVPVVASRVSGLEDIIVDRETGYLHEVSDTAGLAESVCRLLMDVDLRRSLGAAGRASAALRFQSAALQAQWLELLEFAAFKDMSAGGRRIRPRLS